MLSVLVGIVMLSAPVLAQAHPAMAAGADAGWTTYLYDNARTGYDPAETAITPSTAPRLKQAWAIRAKGAISTQVALANGIAYWGSWDGLEHATNARNGRSLWQTQIGQETKADCFPKHLGVASSAAIASVEINGASTLVDFVGGGAGSYYALNAKTGRVIWSHFFGSPADGWFMWSSPAVVGGSVYVGIASIGDCPLTPGAVVKLDAATGAVQAQFATVPPGCTGATVWGSPAIDAATGDVYVTTGNDSGYCDGQPEPYAQALLQLSPDLSLISAWRIPDDQQVVDSDFGTSPTLFTARIGGSERKLVGAANKNGVYYAFVRGEIANGPVWETKTITTNGEMVSSSAFDGRRVYVAGSTTVIGGHKCQGSVRAADPSTGAFAWSDCLRGGDNYAAVTVTPGVVWASVGSILYGLRSTTGQVLFSRQEASGAYYYAPPSFADGAMFIGSPNGWLRKFVPRQ